LDPLNRVILIIGLDIGTTNVKAVAFSDQGQVLTAAERANHTFVPQPGWSEQEPEAVFKNVLSVLQEVISQTTERVLHGIVFSSAMHGLVAVDALGQPLTNFMLWSDVRADAIACQLRQPDGEGTEIYRRTGVPIHAMSPLTKMIWLRQNRPELFHAAHKFLGIKEFVLSKLCGKYVSDLSCASATGLLNIWKNDWDGETLDLAGIAREQLPELLLPSQSIPCAWPGGNGTLFIGASDGALANLGSGATGPGQVSVTIGTSAAIRTMTPTPMVDDQMRTFCYRLDESRCIVGGASNNGTNVLEWLRTAVFRSRQTPEMFVSQAFEIAPGSDGLLCLPYLLGERAPVWNAQARGAFQGLTAAHGQAHFVRAAMEGVLFNLKLVAEAIEEREPIRLLYASGGFSRSAGWVQMLANIFQKPVQVDESGMDASVLGAIHLGRAALGLPQLIDSQQGRLVEPDGTKAELYVGALESFRRASKGA